MDTVITGDVLERRRQKLDSIRSPMVPEWELLAEYIMPRKMGIVTPLGAGAKRTQRLFRSTSIGANELLASSMMTYLTSTSSIWFALSMLDEKLNEDGDVKIWLEDCTTRLYRVFQQPDFASEYPEGYLELGCFGTDCIFFDEYDDPRTNSTRIRFCCQPIGSYWIAEGPDKSVDTVFRRVPMSAGAAMRQWPNTASDKLREQAGRDPDMDVEIIHATFPNSQWSLFSDEAGGNPKLRKKWDFISVYYELDTKNILDDTRGFDDFPFFVTRWTKVSGQIYGMGPGSAALPDIRTFNKATELKLKAWELEINPPMEEVQGALLSDLKLTPAARNVVEMRGQVGPLYERRTLSQPDLREEQLERDINARFYAHLLQLYEQQKSGNAMTAKEVQARLEIMAKIIGPTLGRIQNEKHRPTVDTTFSSLFRRGKLPPPPEALLDAVRNGGGEIKVEYISPLARAQKTADLESIERTIALSMPMAQIYGQEVLDTFDPKQIMKTIALSAGMPARCIRTEKALAEMAQARAEAQKTQVAMQQTAMMAEAAGKAAPMVKTLNEANNQATQQRISPTPEMQGIPGGQAAQ